VLVNKPECILRNNKVSSATDSQSRQSSLDPCDLPNNDETYLTSNNVAEMAPGQRDHAARSLNAARHFLNSVSEGLKELGANLSNSQ
jgi:hypothetical protein